MLGIKRIDHVSVVHSDLEGRVRFYQDLVGMEVAERFESPAAGFKGVAMSIPGSPTQWEIRFLAERGPGMHHATFEVEDIEKAAAALRSNGIEPFGEGIANDWKQLFIHPRDSGGVLIQLYEQIPRG